MNTEMQHLQAALLSVLTFLQHLHPAQLRSLCKFVEPNHAKDMDTSELTSVVTHASAEQLEQLINATSKIRDSTSEGHPTLDVSDDVKAWFGELIQLHQLQQLLQTMSISHFMKLYEVIPQAGQQIEQLQLLQQLQQLLDQLPPDTLSSVHEEFQEIHPGLEKQQLVQLVQLRPDQFHLYQPLRMLLQLDVEELLKMQEVLPRLQPTQMIQLLQLLQMDILEFIEIRRMLFPEETTALLPLESLVGYDSPNTATMTATDSPDATAPPRTLKLLSLQIVEQPPEKAVYKRNLKPNPSVILVGEDLSQCSGDLMAHVSLIKCDTFSEEDKLIVGNKPLKVTLGRVVTFKRLKITATSHQQGESLFCLKFELRKYDGDSYEVLHSVQSNPICVLSHSTQLKPVTGVVPSVTEVIPFSGSAAGGTKVAVLGTNFVDNPSIRVKFDDVDVMPTFHGPCTLICFTPQHVPGIVAVRVSNNNNSWSKSAGSFTYEDFTSTGAVLQTISLTKKLGSGQDSTLHTAAWQGGLETVKTLQEQGSDVNSMDTRQFTALHYAAASGFAEICIFLAEHGADLNRRDSRGYTALHWAASCGHPHVAQALLLRGADPNPVANDGVTPLHIAAALDEPNLIKSLVDCGARLNAVDLAGATPLHVAAEVNPAAAATLASAGAHVNCVDEDDATPLDWALLAGNGAGVSVLKSFGGVSFLNEEEDDDDGDDEDQTENRADQTTSWDLPAEARSSVAPNNVSLPDHKWLCTSPPSVFLTRPSFVMA